MQRAAGCWTVPPDSSWTATSLTLSGSRRDPGGDVPVLGPRHRTGSGQDGVAGLSHATRTYVRLSTFLRSTVLTCIRPAGFLPVCLALAHVFDLGCVALACEQVGVAERSLDMARDYALLGTQFGRPVGSFQVVKHKLANVLLEVEAARVSLVRAVGRGLQAG